MVTGGRRSDREKRERAKLTSRASRPIVRLFPRGELGADKGRVAELPLSFIFPSVRSNTPDPCLPDDPPAAEDNTESGTVWQMGKCT